MQDAGLREDQIQQVRGFADQDLRVPAKPEDASNRRVSIIIKYDTQVESKPLPAVPDAKAGNAGKPDAAKTEEPAKPEPAKPQPAKPEQAKSAEAVTPPPPAAKPSPMPQAPKPTTK
jgi:chemotaxis protein MotB